MDINIDEIEVLDARIAWYKTHPSSNSIASPGSVSTAISGHRYGDMPSSVSSVSLSCYDSDGINIDLSYRDIDFRPAVFLPAEAFQNGHDVLDDEPGERMGQNATREVPTQEFVMDLDDGFGQRFLAEADRMRLRQGQHLKVERITRSKSHPSQVFLVNTGLSTENS